MKKTIYQILIAIIFTNLIGGCIVLKTNVSASFSADDKDNKTFAIATRFDQDTNYERVTAQKLVVEKLVSLGFKESAQEDAKLLVFIELESSELRNKINLQPTYGNYSGVASVSSYDQKGNLINKSVPVNGYGVIGNKITVSDVNTKQMIIKVHERPVGFETPRMLIYGSAYTEETAAPIFLYLRHLVNAIFSKVESGSDGGYYFSPITLSELIKM